MTRDFSFLSSQNEREMLQDAYNAVSVSESWEAMKQEPSEGFMLSQDGWLQKINEHITFNHSGASYGWTMRQIQYIAQNGWEAYVSLRLN